MEKEIKMNYAALLNIAIDSTENTVDAINHIAMNCELAGDSVLGGVFREIVRRIEQDQELAEDRKYYQGLEDAIHPD